MTYLYRSRCCVTTSTARSHPFTASIRNYSRRSLPTSKANQISSTRLTYLTTGAIPFTLTQVYDVEPLLPHATRIATLGSLNRPDQKKLLSQPMPGLRKFEIIDDIYDDDKADDNDLPHTPADEAISWSLPSIISLAVHNTYPLPHLFQVSVRLFHG